MAPFLKRLNVEPNVLTFLGFAVTVLAAFFLASNLAVGGVLVLLGGALDMLDGMVARAKGKITEFGAFLDSVLDRYSDALVFLAVSWNLGSKGETAGAFLGLGTMVGAFIVSYARARAEGLGKKCTTGLMERPERIMLIVFGAFTGWMTEVLLIMFFLTHFTAVQRIWHVWKTTGK